MSWMTAISEIEEVDDGMRTRGQGSWGSNARVVSFCMSAKEARCCSVTHVCSVAVAARLLCLVKTTKSLPLPPRAQDC